MNTLAAFKEQLKIKPPVTERNPVEVVIKVAKEAKVDKEETKKPEKKIIKKKNKKKQNL